MKFYRDTLTSHDGLRLESIQACLEEALTYNNGEHWILNFSLGDSTNPESILFNLRELEKGGFINLCLEERIDPSGPLLKTTHLSLTIAGRNLLDELQQKSRWGGLKKRIGDLAWIVLTSAVTTLIVLWIKG